MATSTFQTAQEAASGVSQDTDIENYPTWMQDGRVDARPLMPYWQRTNEMVAQALNGASLVETFGTDPISVVDIAGGSGLSTLQIFEHLRDRGLTIADSTCFELPEHQHTYPRTLSSHGYTGRVHVTNLDSQADRATVIQALREKEITGPTLALLVHGLEYLTPEAQSELIRELSHSNAMIVTLIGQNGRSSMKDMMRHGFGLMLRGLTVDAPRAFIPAGKLVLSRMVGQGEIPEAELPAVEYILSQNPRLLKIFFRNRRLAMLILKQGMGSVFQTFGAMGRNSSLNFPSIDTIKTICREECVPEPQIEVTENNVGFIVFKRTPTIAP